VYARLYCDVFGTPCIIKDTNVASYDCCSYERSCRSRSTPERRLHQPDSSPSSVTCPPPPAPASAAAASSDDVPLTSSSVQDPPMYGSAALLHRGIYASVRIRASHKPSRSAAGAATPELVTVLPGARCRCAGDDERRTLPCRRRCCREDCVHDAVDTTRSRNTTPFSATGVPRDAAGSARTRSLIVVARPNANSTCPECHTVGLASNAAQNTDQNRNYGTATTIA